MNEINKCSELGMSIQFNSFPDRESMCSRLADEIAEKLGKALLKRNEASLVVSGGNTPKLLFTKLSQLQLEWERVTITLADERWTDTTTNFSNEHLVRSTLLINYAANANFLGLKTEQSSVQEGAPTCNERLQKIKTPFDVVLLGMGDDGHTASLFPGASALPDAMDMKSGRSVIALTPEPMPENAPFERITMTLPKLLDSFWIVLLIAGKQKLSIYNKALADEDDSIMPVRSVLKQTGTLVSSYWAP